MIVSLKNFKSYLGDLIVEERNSFPEQFNGCNVKLDGQLSGGLFVAFNDEENDGLDHIIEAVNAGIVAIATTEDWANLPKEAQHLGYYKIINPTLFTAKAAELFADFPANKLRLYAITGTNGKTTSAMLLHTMLKACYGQAGLLSTLGCDTGSELQETGYTTPPPFTTQKMFAEMVENGIKVAALENSSHGLDQYRTSSAKFTAAIFTNLTGDHLDYHKSMENYFAAKARMFTDLIAEDGVAVINIDDPWGKKLAALAKEAGNHTATFGIDREADYQIKSEQMSVNGSTYELVTKSGDIIRIDSKLCGEHNIYNTAGVAIAAIESGIPVECVQKSLSADVQVAGRLEHIYNDKVDCYVDYAHTDDALSHVLNALKPWCKNRLIAVFGCGGDRDRTKRPRMGKAATTIADITIVTSDNPRTEDPQRIIDDIMPGLETGSNYVIEPDRHKAIKMAITELAQAGDIVLIAGKGHENYQEINGVKHHFDDREECKKWL